MMPLLHEGTLVEGSLPNMGPLIYQILKETKIFSTLMDLFSCRVLHTAVSENPNLRLMIKHHT